MPPLKQAVIPHPTVLGNAAPNVNNMTLPMYHQKNCADGDHNAQSVAQSNPHPEPEGSNWEEEDWNGNKQKAKRGEKQKGGELRRKLTIPQAHSTDHHTIIKKKRKTRIFKP